MARRAVEGSASWVATMRLLAEQRQAGAVPATYARTLRRAADEELAKSAQALHDPASGARPAEHALFAARRRAALTTPLP